jgi:hypothetical protein
LAARWNAKLTIQSLEEMLSHGLDANDKYIEENDDAPFRTIMNPIFNENRHSQIEMMNKH